MAQKQLLAHMLVFLKHFISMEDTSLRGEKRLLWQEDSIEN